MVAEDRAAESGPQTRGFLQILDADRQAVQRRQNVAARNGCIGCLRCDAGVIEIARDHGVHPMVHRFDAVDAACEEFSCASFFWPIRRRASIASRSQGSVISIAQCEAVLAWVRATDQAAARAIDPDRLAAAMRSFHRFHVVPQLRQPLADVARDAMLELHLAA